MLDHLVPIRILIVAPSAAIIGHCALAFKSQLNCNIYECHTLEAFSKQLKLTLEYDILVFARSPEIHSFYLAKCSFNKVSLILSIEENQGFQKSIVTFLSQNKHKLIEKEYVSIYRDLILFHGYTPVDLYICLSDQKITRFLPASSTIEKNDIDHLVELNLDDFCILSKDVKVFQEYSKKNIETHLLEISLHSEQVYDLSLKYKNLLGPQFKNLNQELVNEFDNYFISALKLCFTNPMLKKSIKEKLDANIYFPIHMYVVGFICTRLAHPAGPQETTVNTLFAFASIIHDLANTTENENEIEVIKRLESGEYDTSPEKSSDLLHHGEKVLNWIFTLESLPEWVHDILLKHHERPNGSGFPAGENPQNFAVHTSIFIIAHMIFDDIYLAGKTQSSIPEILKRFSTTDFTNGTIQKVAQRVRELKITAD